MKLTWDETDHERVSALNRKFNKDELLQMDFNAYLASSSDDDEEEDREGEEDVSENRDRTFVSVTSYGNVCTEEAAEEDVKKPEEEEKKKRSEQQIRKYRELLRGIQDKEKKLQEDKDMEMEITWVPGT